MTTEHLIIEETIIHIFSDEIQHALEGGYVIIASNSFWDFNRSCIGYYALLVRDFNKSDDSIPYTLNIPRPSILE